MWPKATTPVELRACEMHRKTTGAAASMVASAPGTFLVAGDHVDHFGGVVAVGTLSFRAAAAYSPREDGTVRIELYTGDTESCVTDSISLKELAQRHNNQQPTIDDNGQTVLPELPTGGLAARWGGVLWTMINRQLLSRDTAGADLTIVADLPDSAAGGLYPAADVAVALALLGSGHELDAPLRARLAEVCAQAVDVFVPTPPIKAQHSAALRGMENTTTVVDYADHSVTNAPHFVGRDERGFILLAPRDRDIADSAVEGLRQRNRFLDAASHAFGAESLRLLPDATTRVIDWLSAVHKVYGAKGQPTVADASGWMHFYDAETTRAREVVRLLRSANKSEVWAQLAASQQDISDNLGLDNANALAQLALSRGALSARAAAAGESTAVVTVVSATRADNFAADLADDGLIVIPLLPGAPAQQESAN